MSPYHGSHHTGQLVAWGEGVVGVAQVVLDEVDISVACGARRGKEGGRVSHTSVWPAGVCAGGCVSGSGCVVVWVLVGGWVCEWVY